MENLIEKIKTSSTRAFHRVVCETLMPELFTEYSDLQAQINELKRKQLDLVKKSKVTLEVENNNGDKGVIYSSLDEVPDYYIHYFSYISNDGGIARSSKLIDKKDIVSIKVVS